MAVATVAAFGLAAVAVVGWIGLSSGEIHGAVTLASCGGAAPRSGPAPCSWTRVPYATVVAIRGTHGSWTWTGVGDSFHGSPAPQAVGSARADSAGNYRLTLPAGDYLVSAKFENWSRDEGNGIHTVPFSAAGQFYPVRVGRLSSQSFDVVIMYQAP